LREIGSLLNPYHALDTNDSVLITYAGETYLFRDAGDHVAYRDLNTRVALKKRKRQADSAEDPFLQPEKVSFYQYIA
jgi:hypothetical protein